LRLTPDEIRVLLHVLDISVPIISPLLPPEDAITLEKLQQRMKGESDDSN